MDQAKAAFEAAIARFGPTVAGLNNITWDQLPHWAQNFIADHPYMSAAQVILIILFAFPVLATTPAFAAIGFAGYGPAAGGWAAAFQAAFGVNMVFSTLQSAAMAGYGASVVAGVVKGGVAAGSAFMWAMGMGGHNGARNL